MASRDRKAISELESKRNHIIPPSLTWLTVFLPALAYFLATRLHDTRLSGKSLGNLVQSTVTITPSADLDVLKEIFYINPDKRKKQKILESGVVPIQQGLYSVLNSGLASVVDTCWKHDGELGRGFLLLSQSSQSGRIWRWEVGGGPIAIGRTLHMEPSGCRSRKYCDDGGERGSGALALDFSQQSTSFEGRLVVAEWGEQRIVRMEESGARTPLILEVPSLCSEKKRRIQKPEKMIFTAFGDLIISDYDTDCQQAALFYLDNAMNIKPLPSALESRKAHSWNATLNHDKMVKVLYSGENKLVATGGIALDATWTGIYSLVEQTGALVQLLHLHLNDDNDEHLWNGQSEVLHEWVNATYPGPITVDSMGNIFVAVDQDVYIISDQNKVAIISLPARATSLTIGEDGFLYISTNSDELLRIKIRSKPLKMPTNLVQKDTK